MYPPAIPNDFIQARTRPLSSAIQAGCICLAIGVCTFWLFGIGFFFLSMAMICGIVAMCAHQVKHGLILLIGSMVLTGACVVLMMIFAIGTVVGVAGAALEATQTPVAPESFKVPDPSALFLQAAEAKSREVRNVFSPVLNQLQVKSSAAQTKPAPDRATVARQKELTELRARQGN